LFTVSETVPHFIQAELLSSVEMNSLYTRHGAPQEGQLEIEFRPEKTIGSPSG
jgi:hypothetical protein